MQGTISVGSGPFGGLVPLDASYAMLPIAHAFNWNECLASVEHGEWYVVSFRSVRRLGSDDALLEEFDRRAFAEASRHSGLSCYFIGEMDDERRCLSMCVWEDRAVRERRPRCRNTPPPWRSPERPTRRTSWNDTV